MAISDKLVKVQLLMAKNRCWTADTVIIAAGYKPNNALYEKLKGKVAELYNVGDSKTPDSIASVVSDGYYAALSL